MKRGLETALLLCLLPLAAAAESTPPQTLLLPGSNTGSFFSPFRFHLGDRPEFAVEMREAGYLINDALVEYDDPNEATAWFPRIKLEDAVAELENLYGVFLWHSHAGELGPSVMAFREDQESLRDAVAASYQLVPRFADRMITGSTMTGTGAIHTIGLTWAAVDEAAWFHDGVVHLQMCNVADGLGRNLDGALATVGPAGTCTFAESEDNVTEFWRYLGREEEGDFWAQAAVEHCPNLQLLTGSEHYAAVQPGCLRGSLGEGYNLIVPPGGFRSFSWAFDSHVDLSVPPGDVFEVDAPPFLPVGAQWGWDQDGFPMATITLTTFPGYTEGSGAVALNGEAVRGAAGVCAANDGVEVFAYIDSNPAADVLEFRVADSVAFVTLGGTIGTREFVVAGSRTGDEPWTETGRAVPDGRRELCIAVGPYPFYRLCEVEESGNVRIHGTTRPGSWSAAATARLPDRTEILARLEQRKRELAARPVAARATTPGVPIREVAYVKDEWLDLALYYQWAQEADPDRDIDVELVPFAAVVQEGVDRRVSLQADMQARAEAGVTSFFLLGPARLVDEYATPWPAQNGWADLQQQYYDWGYPAGADQNDIPTVSWTDARPRVVGDGWFGPYAYSDWLYLDFDGDGWPQPGLFISRFATDDIGRLGLWIDKFMRHKRLFEPVVEPRILFLIGDVNHASDYDGVQELDVGLRYVEQAAGWTPAENIRQYRESEALTDFLRTRATQDLLCEQWANLVWCNSEWSNRYYPGNFLHHNQMLWSQFSTAPGILPVMVFLTCGSADFGWQQSDLWGAPVYERLLGLDNDGPVVFVGFSDASHSSVNEEYGRLLMQKLQSGLCVGAAMSAVLQDLRIRYPDDEYVRRTVLKAHAMGSSLTEVRRERPRVSGLSVTVEAPHLRSCPNPFNPIVEIEIYLPHRSRVDLLVYDVRGRLVRTLVQERLGPGPHHVLWKGKDSKGSSVSSGVYIARLSIDGGDPLTCKLSFVK